MAPPTPLPTGTLGRTRPSPPPRLECHCLGEKEVKGKKKALVTSSGNKKTGLEMEQKT